MDQTALEKDSKKQDDADQKAPSSFRNVILIRHGQYDMSGVLDEERVLTSLGKSQADLTGRRLKALGFNYTRILSSTMTRAMQTTKEISEHFPSVAQEKCHLLREIESIVPPPTEEERKRVEAAYLKYIGETDEQQEGNSYEIIVCHGHVIRYFICKLGHSAYSPLTCANTFLRPYKPQTIHTQYKQSHLVGEDNILKRAMQFPVEFGIKFLIHHASITWLILQPNGQITLRALNDIGHMPPDMITR